MVTSKLAALTCCLLILMGPLALAERPDKDDLARADKLLRKGNAHYAAKRYQKAIDAYREAHDLSEAPGFLFNIAQVYRLWGKCREAITYYEEFLAAAPETSLRPQVEGFVRDLWVCVDSEERSQQPADPPPELALPPGPGKEASSERESATGAAAISLEQPNGANDQRAASAWRWVGLGTAAAGLTAAGAGVYFGLQARSASRDVEAFVGEWGPDQESLQRTAQSHERRAVIFGVAGAAALVSGAAMYLIADSDDEPPRRSLAIVPSSRGGVVMWSWTR